ncbi:cyclase family protein [Leucobacter sp. CSA2]|uniref:Cyclase family protein n=1 Tax=Leucobacter edaphi TaxID=2796472 RepID=A0A934QDM6_9MICO|nr:cyclase family protein [Leucobacter edaphi]MBK0422711.1 cyclase family protein [Leucobacter edaphi]
MIDLSHPIATGMTVYPGDPAVRVRAALSIARDGSAVAALELGTHTGTHVDAPAHIVPGGRTIDRVGLDELIGEALVLDPTRGGAEPLSSGESIGIERLGIERLSRVPAIVIVRTGWDRRFGGRRYFRHPHLAPEAAERLCELGMHVLGVDMFSPDPTPNPGEEGAFPVHEIVLGADGLIVENLRGLEALGERAQLGFFPLPVRGGDGAPVRAVAWRQSAGGRRRG